MKITYRFVTGEVTEVEVDGELAETMKELDRQEYNSNRRVIRNKQISYSRFNDKHEIMLGISADMTDAVDDRMERESLHKAIAELQPQQQELVRKVFFEGCPMADVAHDEHVDHESIRRRLFKIYRQLKKYFV